MANTLPLPYQFVADTKCSEVVRQVEATMCDAERWQEYFSWQRFASVDHELQNQEPFCPFSFEYETLPAAWRAGQLQWMVEEQEACLDRFKLCLSCLESSHGIHVRLYFDQGRFAKADMQRLLKHWQTVLQQMLAGVDMTVGSLQLLDSEEQYQILNARNRLLAE